MNAIFVIGDVDQNGEIDLEEFKRMMLPTSFDVVSKFRSVHKTTRDVQNAFRKFDINNDGSIDRLVVTAKSLLLFDNLDLSWPKLWPVEASTSPNRRLLLFSTLPTSTRTALWVSWGSFSLPSNMSSMKCCWNSWNSFMYSFILQLFKQVGLNFLQRIYTYFKNIFSSNLLLNTKKIRKSVQIYTTEGKSSHFFVVLNGLLCMPPLFFVN